MSLTSCQTEFFKINTPAHSYHIKRPQDGSDVPAAAISKSNSPTAETGWPANTCIDVCGSRAADKLSVIGDNRGSRGRHGEESQSREVDGSAAGRDDVGPDLVDCCDKVCSCGLSYAQPSKVTSAKIP